MTVLLILPIVLLLALLWLLFGYQAPKTDLTDAALEIKKLLPVHCRHFPQIHHILSAKDREFIDRRAPRHIAKQWQAERRQVLRLYLRGLAQDFQGLEQLARLIAALSPQVERKREWEWLWLGLQFRMFYRMTLLQFALHRLPPGELVRLTEMLTSLALRLEHSIERMTEAFPQVQINPGS